VGVFINLVREIIGPLVIAALLAYLLEPIVSILHNKLRFRRNLAVLVVFVMLLLVLAAIPAVLTPVVIRQIDSIRTEVVNLQESVQSFLSQDSFLGIPLPGYDISFDVVSTFTELVKPEQIVNLVQSITENVAWFFIIAVSIFYLLLDAPRMWNWIFKHVPQQLQRDVQKLYDELQRIWKAYLRGQISLMIIMGIISWVAAALLGLPGASLIGLVAGLFDILPTVGPALVTPIAGIVAFIEGSTHFALPNIWVAVLAIGIFTLIHTVENLWLRPMIMGQALQLHKGLVFVAIIGALTISGALLALIIVPIISSVGIIGRYLFCKILDIDPWEEMESD
jgi:predicted PurR-regulated permease PerM